MSEALIFITNEIMTPEEKTRQDIDHKLWYAGWEVVDRKYHSPTLSAVAVAKGILKGNLEIVTEFEKNFRNYCEQTASQCYSQRHKQGFVLLN